MTRSEKRRRTIAKVQARQGVISGNPQARVRLAEMILEYNDTYPGDARADVTIPAHDWARMVWLASGFDPDEMEDGDDDDDDDEDEDE